MKFSKMERVETVHVQRLHNNQTHQEVETGKKYHALLMGETAQLNPQVKARLVNPMDAAGQKQGAVLVTRTPNGQLEAKYLKGRFELEPETVLVSDLTPQDMNKKFSLQGKIEAIKQTGGPTLFTLFDGSGTLTIKGFISAGARAYPEINEDDVVTTMVQMIEHEGVMEGEILRIQKIPVDQQDAFAKRLQKILYDRSRPDNVPFLVDSPILHKLAPLIEQAVITIKMAIADNRPIILKHHADTDGYSAAMTLQRAMLPLVLAQHNEEKAMWMYYKRTPSKSPYYDYFDATRDIGYSLSDNAKYNQKMPLIIIVDTGSGEEDAFPIQKVKLFGCQVVVIDHHVPGKNDPISKLADAHINPHLVGDEYSYSAGMLCAEVARKINKDAPNIDYIPALSGLSDRIESDELAQYIAIAEKQGYSREYLEKLGTVIDFEAWNFKFDESRELVDILFGSDRDLQKKTVELLHPEITRRFARQLAINQHNCEIKMVKNVVLAKLDIGQNANFNTYPPAGKSLSSLHDWVQTQHPGKPVLSIGYASDFVTIRATDGTNFSIIGFVDRVQKKFPYGGIDGGGHEHAGSIKAIPSIMPKVLQEFETVLAESQ